MMIRRTRGVHGVRRPGRLRWIALAAVAAGIVWGVGLFRFAAVIPTEAGEVTTSTDAIVVLTGGSRRLATGLDLLSANAAGMLFVSGVYRGVDVSQLLRHFQDAPDELRCCVEIGHEAGDTAGNAEETAAWVRRQDFRSLRIVTSNYHMPRSMLEFRHALPGVTLIAHPVVPESFRNDGWWRWPGSARLIVSEFNKYLLVWAAHAIENVIAPGGGDEL